MAKYLVQHRRGTAAQWAEQDTLIPREGEIVIEIDEVNSLHKLKIGDGVHTYAELAYLQAGDEIVTQVLAQAKPRVVTIELTSNWSADEDDKYSQTIALDNITEHSRLDLQPNASMLAEFKQLGLVFVTENNAGTITVYSVGNMPSQSYTMQATIVETECDGVDAPIVGIPVGTPIDVQIDTSGNFVAGEMPDGQTETIYEGEYGTMVDRNSVDYKEISSNNLLLGGVNNTLINNVNNSIIAGTGLKYQSTNSLIIGTGTEQKSVGQGYIYHPTLINGIAAGTYPYIVRETGFYFGDGDDGVGEGHNLFAVYTWYDGERRLQIGDVVLTESKLRKLIDFIDSVELT